jgi:hypothetical protein
MRSLIRRVLKVCTRSSTMMGIKTLVLLGAMSVSVAASASTVTATITRLVMGTGYGDYVFIELSAAKTGNPACSTSGFGFVLPLASATENQMLALLLSARATQTPMYLIGTGACSNFGNVETLGTVEY